MSTYTTIDSGKIVSTIELLEARIEERFPDSGLRKVCHQLREVAVNMKKRAEWIARPVRWLRILTWVFCFLIIAGTIVALYAFGFDSQLNIAVDENSKTSFTDFVTIVEAGINDILLIGAAIFFLLSFETRYKRRRALKALHELRSIAHVIDMHQLTKDPHRIATKGNMVYVPGRMSPKMNMTEFQLRRYLDYCSEMLSLTGKIAAVYVQAFDDGVAMASASELETLTSGLSNKIWQKILILESFSDEDSPPSIVKEP
jgi:hypothetical protein